MTTPAETQYRGYLSTPFAKAEGHGIFAVTPDESNGIHATKKKPLGAHGCTDWQKTAEQALHSANGTDRLLGRHFNAKEDGVIGIDFDGWIPEPKLYSWRGYREISSSGTGVHLIVRIPTELIPAEGNKTEDKDKGIGIEVFYGAHSALALTGTKAETGDIDLDMDSEIGKKVIQVLREAKQKQTVPKRISTSVGENPIAAGEDCYQQYDRWISYIGEVATKWEPKDGFKQEDDASAHLWALACYICKWLKSSGFPLDHSATCFSVIYNIIVPSSSVWTHYYAKDAKYGQHDGHPEKLEKTIHNAIDETLKGSAGAEKAATFSGKKDAGGAEGSGDKNIVLDVVKRAEEYIHIKEETNGTTTFFFNKQVYCQVWQDITHLCIEEKTKDGYLWYDGTEWQQDPHGTKIRGYLDKAADLLAAQYAPIWAASGKSGGYEGLLTEIQYATLRRIRAKRAEPSANPTAAYGKGLTLRDGVMIIDAKGIHITSHNPDKDVWFGAVDAVSTELIKGLENISTFEEVMKHFPNALASLLACGEEKARAMATIAGVVVYYTMPQHKPLDYFGYWWDANIGGTGKSTHIKHFTEFFGRYLASGVSWDTFTGKSEENGNFFGKVGVICEEAGVNDVKNIETIKTRTSGEWECRRLYYPRVGIRQPLLMLTLGNTKPLLSHVANKEPIWDRLQPCEFTIKHRDTGKAFPCDDEEYNRFLLNAGTWVALQLMRVGEAVSKKDLPYHVTPDEVKELCERVPWEDVMTMPEVGMWQSGAEEALKDVYEAVKATLRKQGWESFTGAPQLRSIESFKRSVDGMSISRGEGRYGYLKVVGVNETERHKYGKYKVKNYVLNYTRKECEETEPEAPQEHQAPQEPAGRREVSGSYHVDERTGTVVKFETAKGENKGWNVEKFIHKPDPHKELLHTSKYGTTLIKKAVFVVEGNRLIDIKPPKPEAAA